MARTRLVVAQVRGLHGLEGAVRVEVLTDKPEARFVVGEVLHVEGGTRHSPCWPRSPLKTTGLAPPIPKVPNRQAAEPLREGTRGRGRAGGVSRPGGVLARGHRLDRPRLQGRRARQGRRRLPGRRDRGVRRRRRPRWRVRPARGSRHHHDLRARTRRADRRRVRPGPRRACRRCPREDIGCATSTPVVAAWQGRAACKGWRRPARRPPMTLEIDVVCLSRACSRAALESIPGRIRERASPRSAP